MTRLDEALLRVIECAQRLPPGDSERHVLMAVEELQRACANHDGVAPAVRRVVDSVRQLQGHLGDGTRRHQRESAPGVERLLEVLQESLLPELQHAGLL